MIKHTAAVLAFVAGVSAFGAAHATAAPPLQRPAAPAAQTTASLLQTWVAGVSGWMLRFQQSEAALGTLLRSVADDSATAETYIDRNDAKGGAAWAADWATTRRRQTNELRAGVLALPGTPPAAPQAFAAAPQIRRYEAALTTDARVLRDMLLQDLDFTNDLIDLIEKAAGGDRGAAGQMGVRMIDTSIALFRGENTMMQAEVDHATILGGASPDPEADLLAAIIKSNEAMIGMINGAEAESQGASPDVDQVAKARSAIDASKAAARLIPVDAARALVQARAPSSGAGAELIRRAELAMQTYGESADVELAIDDKLLAVIDGMGAGSRIDPARLGAALQDVDQLSERRVALDQRRKQIMAGQGQ